MAYNVNLEKRIAPIAAAWENGGSRKMFGGICYLLKGNMVCGIYKDFLILRLGEAVAERHLPNPHVKPFDITGRPMKGWIMVDEDGYASDGDLERWIHEAKRFAESLPAK